jgi:hypothetical protein
MCDRVGPLDRPFVRLDDVLSLQPRAISYQPCRLDLLKLHKIAALGRDFATR